MIPICPLFAKTGMTDMAVEKGFPIKEWITVDSVIDAFMLGIEDESISGEPIRITLKYGVDLPFRKRQTKL